jgi:hypothetical protein
MKDPSNPLNWAKEAKDSVDAITASRGSGVVYVPVYDYQKQEVVSMRMSKVVYDHVAGQTSQPEPEPEPVTPLSTLSVDQLKDRLSEILDPKWVCADCGVEQDKGPCTACGSIRIVSIAFLDEHVGTDWRKYFEKPD